MCICHLYNKLTYLTKCTVTLSHDVISKSVISKCTDLLPVYCCCRFIVMRRLFALTGTVFMLRCVTMLITSLSVPGVHLQCEPQVCHQCQCWDSDILALVCAITEFLSVRLLITLEDCCDHALSNLSSKQTWWWWSSGTSGWPRYTL